MPFGSDATFDYTVDVDQAGVTDSGWQVGGAITISNSNDWEAIALTDLQDALDIGGTCAIEPVPLIVPANGSVELRYSCSFDAAPSGYAGTNTATATWDAASAATPTGMATGHANVELTQLGSTNRTITVTDTYAGDLGTVTAGDGEPFTHGTFEYQRVVTGTGGTCDKVDNTATITETGASATATATVCTGLDLTVSKTADPSYDRSFGWSIAKSVDRTLVEQLAGSVTFRYTVDVSHDAGTDAAWTIRGTVAVTNPNDFASIDATIGDVVDGGDCTLDAGLVTLAPSQTVEIGYECRFASAPGSGTNIATVTWDGPGAATPTSSSSGSADFAFGDPTMRIDECTNVADTFAGVLGTVCASDPGPRSFTYTRTVAVVPGTCVRLDNTATFVTNDTGTAGSASRTAHVCGPVVGGLTIGYWSNRNGQARIVAAGPATGICSLTGELRAYAPFADLSPTATCSGVAAYVANVIKVANASGASMNAMLKAQMLAVALSVHYAPSLGSTRVDLTRIDKPIGSTTFEDARAAFGGATSMSVNEMLATAASQSNIGGSAWYGQVKSMQEPAKDAFDAIANNVAFVAP